MDKVIKIAQRFALEGTVVSAREYGDGHINDTYLVVCQHGDHTHEYVIQRINRNVFADGRGLMNNMEAVTSYTRAILEREGLAGGKLICVHKPFMERRLYAAMKNYWPEANAVYTSPQLSMEEYIQVTAAQGMTEQGVIDVLVGDFQRMDVYAKRGYQIPQDIPQTAWSAFEKLVELGCTGELVLE